MEIRERLGVQSWCFRHFKRNEEVIDKLKECGLKTIELAPVHLDANNKEEVERVLKLYEDNGISISSYGVVGIPNDERAVRPAFELAKRAGIKTLGVGPAPDSFELLEKMCQEYNIKAAIHNHGRKDRYGSPTILEEVFKKSSPNIGLCLDTAWMLDSGENPLEVARRFKDRLYGLHLKDFVFQKDGSPEDVIIGTGNLDLKGILDFLTEIAFDGFLTLEYEGDIENPVPSVIKSIEEISKALVK